MSYGNPEKICSHEPCRRYRKYLKLARNRKQRRRARKVPDCPPEYKRFYGWSI